MNRVDAPAWTADWLNAWLAAIGATVLVDGLKLHWSDTVRPHAVFTTAGGGPLGDVLAAALPSKADLEQYALATRLEDVAGELKRYAPQNEFVQRAEYARERADASLGVVLTDLGDGSRGTVQPSAFNVPGPGPVGTIHDRVLAVLGSVDATSIEQSMVGTLPRSEQFGLGFDERRFIESTYAVKTGNRVDPVIEVFAFFGMLLFPVRGDGKRSRTRGWRRHENSDVFEWIAWREPLTVAGIDALLDVFGEGRVEGQCYRSVTRRTEDRDVRIGYGSEPK